MSLTETQQLFELIKKSQNILIALPKNPSIDAIATSLALRIVLGKMEKQTDIVCHEFNMPQYLLFLPESDSIQTHLSGLKRFIISIDTKHNKIKDFSYDVKDESLEIYLTPHKDSISDKQVSLNSSKYKYNLIITLDSPDLESLGPLYDTNTEFFYTVPIINIGHSADNEQFGNLNVVDITKTSTAEIIFDLIEDHDIKLMDDKIATTILTGLISKTKSFKTPNVTPRALNIASRLILNGADRELIIKSLYQTKSINTLKLWGKALARLKNDPENSITWSFLPYSDFDDLQITDEKLTDVIEELIANAPEAQVVMLFYEYPEKKFKAILYSSKNHDSLYLTRNLDALGNKTFAYFDLEGNDLIATGKDCLEEIKRTITKTRI